MERYDERQESLQQEKDLSVRLSRGDERAFDELYKLYGPSIYKNILRLVKQADLAEEIFQDVFMKIWEKRGSLNIETSFKSYLFRIAQNKVVDLFRRAAFDRKLLEHLTVVSTELHNDTEEKIHLKDTQLLLQEAIDALPPQRKKIYIMCKMEGKSYEEVSALLGISTSTISDHIVKGTRSVKEHLSDHELILLLITAALIARR